MKSAAVAMAPESADPLYRLDGCPPLSQAIPIGLQHVFAMFTGNLAPILILAGAVGGIGKEAQLVMIQSAMLMAGLITMLQLYPISLGRVRIGARLPVVMGTSFAFLPSMKAVAASYGIPGVLGGALLGGFVEFFFGIFIRPIKRFFPAYVIGAVLVAIGINLLGIGATYFAGGAGAPDFGSWQNLALSFTVLAVITTLNRLATGMLRTVSILVGIGVGYVIAAALGKVDFAHIAESAWFDVPRPLYFMPAFHLDAIVNFAAVYIIVGLETMGNTAGITAATLDRDTTSEETSGTIVAAAVGSQIGAVLGALPMAAFGQNAGIVSMTRVINRFAIATGAALMIVGGFCPKIGAIFSSLPPSVLGGAVVTVFAMIFLNGIKMMVMGGMNESKSLSLAMIFGLGYGLGLSPEATAGLPGVFRFVFGDPITAVCVVGVVANLIFRPSEK